MRILVCVKIVHDLEAVSAGEWETVTMDHPDIGWTMKQLNCYDEAALESALRIRDGYDDAEVDVLTAGSGDHDLFFRNMFAAGVGKIIRIDCEETLDFHPDTVAGLLSAYASGYDVVLTGSKNAHGENGMTQYRLSKLLGIPCLNHVISLERAGDDIRVAYERDDAVRTVQVRTPVILSVGNSDTPYLRIATLREKLKVKNRKAEHVRGVPAGKETFELCGLSYEQARRSCVMIEGSDMKEKAEILYRDYLSGRMGS